MALLLATVTAASAACGSSRSSGSAPLHATCARFGSTGGAAGVARITRVPAVALLRNVQIQASTCVDEVAFLFMGGIPAWSVGYRDDELTEDPGGRPIAVAGRAHLVIRFEPATGVDLASDRALVTYDGPADLRPPAPSGVAEVRRLGDFESVTSWVLGLADQRRFQVVTRGNQVVVRLPATTPRATRCLSEGGVLSVGFPPGWYVELSDRWACRYFDPAPFVVYPATDSFSWAVTVQQADTSAATLLARIGSEDPPASAAHVKATRVAGLPATVLTATTSGRGLYPAGYAYRIYIVDSGARAVTIQSTPGPPGPETDARQLGADRIAALALRG